MSDKVIDAIRSVDPCPSALPAPPIEVLLHHLREEPAVAEPPPPRRWRPTIGAMAVLVSVAAAAAVAVLAIVLLGHARRTSLPATGSGHGVGVLACRPEVRDAVLPTWARAGFSQPRPRMPYALGASGRIAAILFVTLDSPAARNRNNKILWVSRVPTSVGHDLRIQAQQMAKTKRLGAPVNRTVTGGPGPSIINLPAPGCWRLTLRWSGWTDHLDLQYNRPG